MKNVATVIRMTIPIHNRRKNYLSKHFCSGCGICVLVCREKAITLVRDVGGFWPSINGDTCTQCGLCSKSCPIIQALIDRSFALDYIDEYAVSDLVGYYRGSYAGYCIDDTVRQRASSGGMISALLIYLLENSLIDAAVTVVQRSDFKSTADLFTSKIARTKDDVLKAQGSKYIQVSMEDAIEEIVRDSTLKRIAVVGTGCQIRALRLNVGKIPGLSNRMFYYLGLFCKQTKVPGFTNYLLNIVGRNIDNISQLRFREGEFPSFLTIDGVKMLSFKEWRYGFMPWFTNAYASSGCLVCGDCTAEYADISFGDAWLPQYEQEDAKYSVLLTRSEFGDRLIQMASEENIITTEEIDSSLIPESQMIEKIIIKKLNSHVYGWMLNRKAHIKLLDDVLTNQRVALLDCVYVINNLFWARVFSSAIFGKLCVNFSRVAYFVFRFAMKINRIVDTKYLDICRRRCKYESSDH